MAVAVVLLLLSPLLASAQINNATNTTIYSNTTNTTSFIPGELCDAPDDGCPVARCASPPAGCQYIFDHYVWTEVGTCCAELCYSVDSEGQECGLVEDDQTAAAAAAVPGAPCDSPNDGCPVARCASPPPGCNYIFDHYVWTETGTCCASLCYAVDNEGQECNDNVGVDRLNNNNVPGETCDAPDDNNLCPMARCTSPPEGCDYVFDQYVWNEEGVCCPKLCFAVDGEGQECKILVEEEEAATPFIGESCDTPAGNACPMARCMEPPAGCSYVFDEYVLNEEGVCCPRLCYAVDGEGQECSFEETTGAAVEGELCDTPEEEKCPVADCTEAPVGCTYVFDHYVWDSEGTCCPSLCYAVNGEGQECTADTTGGRESAIVGDVCDPVSFGTPPEQCPVALCAPLPDGCEYTSGGFIVTEDRNCCERLCYAEDAEGKECIFDDANEQIDNTEDTAPVGSPCEPDENENASCPVAGCASPPEGCEYEFGNYVINQVGNCCERLCYAVDGNGMECSVDETASASAAAYRPLGLLLAGGTLLLLSFSLVVVV